MNVSVFSCHLTGGQEVGIDGHVNQVEYDAVVLAPVSLGVTADDRMVLPWGDFMVDGPPGDWENNPWWSSGLVQVRLRRVSHED